MAQGSWYRRKIILTFLVPLPLAVLNSGVTTMHIPFLGPMDLGLLFPLIIIPIALIGTVHGTNILAGYNGLEAGLSSLIITGLGYLSWQQGNYPLSALCLCFVTASLVFLAYNRYPARIFPGDIYTFIAGALIGSAAILSNIESYALIMFLPHFAEAALKLRGKLKRSSWARCAPDGSLTNTYNTWYGLPNVAISTLRAFKIKATEPRAVGILLTAQLLLVITSIVSYHL
ncbi:MAG: hypothetical protein HC945_03390 [Nitrosarchaeum sp.]|nr:hypothetical protein [Nitrosarchaeum sp.]